MKSLPVLVGFLSFLSKITVHIGGDCTSPIPAVTAIDGTALAGLDFEMPHSTQVQLAPGEAEKTFTLRLVSDGVYEATEYFTLQLHSPVSAALEAPLAATVRINDSRDESVVSLGVARLEVREDTGEALVPLLRTGDVSDELQVICFTASGSATGTVPHTVTSFSDYITRSRDHYSIIRFDKGQHNVFCPVTIIDDSLYERSETFHVFLGDPLGGQLGPQNRTEVVILKDEEDEPVVYFGRQSLEVDESAGELEVLMWRAGTDLSLPAQVTVRSRPDPDRIHPAQVGVDYVGVHRVVNFNPGESLQQLRVQIVDDLGVVSLEGSRSFQLVLTMPDNVTLGDPSTTTIRINDSASDLPQLKFEKRSYSASETEGTVTAVVERSGDLSFATSVRCYTRQATATVAEDFAERPDTDASLVTFMPGQREADCTVRILADDVHEGDEKFHLVLGSPRSSAPGGARLKQPSRAAITVTDDADKSVIMFGETRFVIREPLSVDRVTRVTLPVVRVGDTSLPAVVRVYTRDGTARAAKDYIGFSKELTFAPGVTSQEVEVVILYDDEVELREAFTVLITHDKNRVAKVKNGRAVVFVEEMTGWADVTFPSPPIVISLKDYDTLDSTHDTLPAGYPVICVTACDPRYPDYKAVTHSICQREGVNNSLTQYRWRVAPPPGANGIADDLSDLETNTFFTSVNSATLDSIFFSPGGRVECAARAVNRAGEPGLELSSRPVTVSSTTGTCPPLVQGSVGAEPYTATITYTGHDDEEHPNMVAVRVRIPHRDGLIPVISTQPITNLEFALSDSAFRVAQHVCSNLLTPAEVTTGHGFVDGHVTSSSTASWAHRLPYENDVRLRTNNTVNFYRALDLESCLWQFEGYYSVSELVTMCGGTTSAVGQVLDLTQSFLSITVPLYVSYVYFSASLLRQWAHYDVDTTLRLTFVYNTAVTWRRAVMPSGGGQFQGRIHPLRMQINSEGRLVVTFESEALFRGRFVASYSGTSLQASVTCPDKPRFTFALNLLRSDSTSEYPRQTWQFTSDLVAADYTCVYVVSLVPCVAPPDGTSRRPTGATPAACRPHSPVPFSLPLILQQVNKPVNRTLTLEASLGVWRKRSSWLAVAAGSTGGDVRDAADVTFTPDDTIYGVVQLNSNRLGAGFRVSLEKVFLCTGVAGQVPDYEPGRGQYGCLGPNNKLLHTIRVLDKGSPAAINTRFQGADFEARFVDDDPAATGLAKSPRVDGFSFSAKPLFRVDPGHHWFLHTIYTIQSAQSHRGRREVSHSNHAVSSFDVPGNIPQGRHLAGHHATNTRHHRQHHRRHDVHRERAPPPSSAHTEQAITARGPGTHRKVSPLETSKMLSTNQNTVAAAATRTRTLSAVAARSPASLDTLSVELALNVRATPKGAVVIRPEPHPGLERHKREAAAAGQEGVPHTGTGTNMVVIALDYSNTVHSSSLYSEEGGGEEKSGPQVALVAGLSTAFIILVATVLVAITVARYNCLHEEDTCDSDSSCHEGAAHNLPPPPPPPSTQPPNQLCGKVTQV